MADLARIPRHRHRHRGAGSTPDSAREAGRPTRAAGHGPGEEFSASGSQGARHGARLRHALLWALAALLASGLAWLAGHDLWPEATPLGPQPRAWTGSALRAHGALAWLTVLAAGMVWQAHVRPAWRAVRRRLHRRRAGAAPHAAAGTWARTASGATVVGALAVLLLSAIGLQYGPQDAHAWLSPAHWVAGLVFAAAAAWHGALRLRA